MLKSIENKNEEFLEFCNRDVFGTRIKAYYNAYGENYDFVKFWIQLDDNDRVISAISRVDGDMTITSTGENCDELAQFVRIVGFVSIQCEKSIAVNAKMKSSLDGYVVEYTGDTVKKLDAGIKNKFELKEVYDIIKAAELVGVGDYLPWLSDTTYRVNRDITEVHLACEGNQNAGCAMVLFRTDKAALLGGVATVPEFRGRGISGALVTGLALQEKSAGRRVELLCKQDSIVEFYKSIGFVVKNEWSIIKNEAEFL